jgi:hypothetical protein
LEILIYNSDNSIYKEYVVTANEPKIVIDLTADLAITRFGQDITTTQFKLAEFGGDQNTFHMRCVHILKNMFFSYTFED